MGPEQAVDDAPQRICAGSVSTHALREESDRQVPQVIDSRTVFQSTPSARIATPTHEGALSLQAISIHALREESDTAAA